MPVHHTTAPDPWRQDPFRWPHADIRHALDQFAASAPPSQREFAEQVGIPHATFNYWQRHYTTAVGDPTDAFFGSAAGALVLRRIVLAALTTFQIQGGCGLRLVSTFLERSALDRFVASSRGALQPLAAHCESDLVVFRDQQQPLLVQKMQPKTITVTADEHFHSVKPCLVALEPISGFLLVECYRDNRAADTWTQAITEGTTGMPVQIVLLTSDRAKALLCCAAKGLEVVHSPDLFHGQRDLLKPLLLPLNRPIQQAEKDLEKAEQRCHQLDTPLPEPTSEQEFLALVEAVRQHEAIANRLEQAQELQAEAVQQVRGLGDDYHPFDRRTGQPVTAAEVGQRLASYLDKLQAVVAKAGLGVKAHEAVHRSRQWLGTLVGCVAWFWCLAQVRVEELDLSEQQEQVVNEKLLAGHYWAMAAGRARTPEERKRLQEMAAELQKEAWQEDGVLAALPEEKRQQVQRVTYESAGLFQRSSSCVEGRNGRLSLQQHGHSRVSEQRLKALTVIHNYMVQRADGTTAAQRFFGQQHKDLFSWLLERLPDLPRPAQKRRKTAVAGLTEGG